MPAQSARPHLCVLVVSVQHGGVAFPQPVKELHQEGRLTPGQRVPHLLHQHWQKHKVRPFHPSLTTFRVEGLADLPTRELGEDDLLHERRQQAVISVPFLQGRLLVEAVEEQRLEPEHVLEVFTLHLDRGERAVLGGCRWGGNTPVWPPLSPPEGSMS